MESTILPLSLETKKLSFKKSGFKSEFSDSDRLIKISEDFIKFLYASAWYVELIVLFERSVVNSWNIRGFFDQNDKISNDWSSLILFWNRLSKIRIQTASHQYGCVGGVLGYKSLEIFFYKFRTQNEGRSVLCGWTSRDWIGCCASRTKSCKNCNKMVFHQYEHEGGGVGKTSHEMTEKLF